MAAATTEPRVSRGRRKHPDLIFEWMGSRSHRWRLLLFLNGSLALHVACFYAFQVVYPPSARQRPETTKVTYLDPRHDPGVREVIGRIEDRAVFFDGSLRLSIPGASLENDQVNQVIPVPSFATHEPQLKVLPSIASKTPLPRIFTEDDVFLPAQSRLLPGGVPAPRPEPFAGVYVYLPKLVLSGGLGVREIVAQPDWTDSQETLATAGDDSIRFLVEVDASGRIISCLPWLGVENTFDAAMAEKVESETKFAPSKDTSRGWLEMRW